MLHWLHMQVGLLCAALLTGYVVHGDVTTTTRIAFGSCSQVDMHQPLWPAIVAREPHAWIWAGDNIYGDKGGSAGGLFPHLRPASPDELRHQYAVQKDHPGYRELLSRGTMVVGTWDDHDFGTNDGDSTFAHKQESQQAFLDFLDVPADSPRRHQAGIYSVHEVEAPGGHKVAIILLDVRYHQVRGAAEQRTLLGEEQWAWLDGVLARSTAQVHLIVSGIQVLPTHRLGRGWPDFGEAWGRFPEDRLRLFRLLRRHATAAPVLLSGDVHFAEINRVECRTHGEAGPSTNVVEITSSGLTHSWGTLLFLVQLPTLGKLLSPILVPVVWAFYYFIPQPSSQGRYLDLNFGEVEVEWGSDDPIVGLHIFGLGSRVPLSGRWNSSQLTFASSGLPETAGADQDLQCVPYRGLPWYIFEVAGFPAFVVFFALWLCCFFCMLPVRVLRALCSRWAYKKKPE